MRTLEDARLRWKVTFEQNSSLSDLKAAVRRDTPENPCHKGLRSVCWKAFLLFENLDRSTWPKTLSDSRSAYASLRDHFLHDIEHPDDLSATDPLADDITSPWNTLRRDEILRDEIYQDVDRCMPDNLYFREPTTQSALLDILLIFCKLNADIGYRQGMHEVLAPIVWVVSRDAMEAISIDQQGIHGSAEDELLQAILNRSYVEHDAFTIFCIIMQTAKSFYELGSSDPATGSHNSPIVERSKRIHDEYLRKVDLDLTQHLTSIDILPQIFVIRWIRLLFGREFPFDDVLSLWDVLFAEDPGLDLLDYVCVAMLLRIRWQLIEADYSSALTLLLRYPAPLHPNGPRTFVDDALYLRRDLTADGGSNIISKYSGKSPTSGPKTSRNASHFKRANHHDHTKPRTLETTRSPLRSPAQYLLDQGGIEGILQEAAKGVYSRGEKWGVGRALRGAVQGLSGNNSPRFPVSATKWSFDDGKTVATATEDVVSKIKALEDRNKALSKMLVNAMEDLWSQQKVFEKEEAESVADALSIAIAKVQFVQVYLEDSSLPLVPEPFVEAAEPNHENPQSMPKVAEAIKDPPQEKDTSDTHSNSSSNPGTKETALVSSSSNEKSSQPKGETSPRTVQPARTPDTPKPDPAASPTSVSLQSPKRRQPQTNPSQPFHHPRPSLAQSSFSWMLGEDQRKTSFISPKPFPAETRRDSAARGKAGFLFGDDKSESSGMGKGKGRGKEGKEEKEDDDGFTLGTLKGLPKGI